MSETTAPPVTIAEFLTDRLDDAERRAKAQGHWADGWLEPEPRPVSSGYVGAPVRPNLDEILADIAAKRAIMNAHKQGGTMPPHCGTCQGQTTQGWAYPCDTLRILASVYAEHPGYREEWRP